MSASLYRHSRDGGPSGLRSPLTLMLDESGMIRDCCLTSEEMFGYSLRTLVSQHVSMVLPQLSGIELVQDGQLNSLFEDLCQGGYRFSAHTREGAIFPSELTLVSQDLAGRRALRLFVLPCADAAECAGDEFPMQYAQLHERI